MDESKMTMMQRKKVDHSLRSGKPLPSFEDFNMAQPTRNHKEKVTVRPGSSKRRMHSTIVDSGAYERDLYRPIHPKVDREMAKKHLQDIMSYGKELKASPRRVVKKKPLPSPRFLNRFDQLKQEIQDREDWLAGMDELGEAEKHRLVIQQQIEARLREMENLKISQTTRRSDTRRTDTRRTEPGRTDTGRTDAGRTDTGRTDAGRIDSRRTAPGRTNARRSETCRTDKSIQKRNNQQ